MGRLATATPQEFGQGLFELIGNGQLREAQLLVEIADMGRKEGARLGTAQIGDQLVAFDPFTRREVNRIDPSQAFQDAQAAEAAADAERERLALVNVLADDFRAQAGPFQVVAQNVAIGRASSDTAQGDINLIVAVSKARDPNSAVTLGEVDLASPGGLQGRFLQLWNKVNSDGRLDSQTRADLEAELENIARTQADAFRSQIADPMLRRAQDAGIDPSLFFVDPFGPAPDGSGIDPALRERLDARLRGPGGEG